jgi:hypothetical protein
MAIRTTAASTTAINTRVATAPQSIAGYSAILLKGQLSLIVTLEFIYFVKSAVRLKRAITGFAFTLPREELVRIPVSVDAGRPQELLAEIAPASGANARGALGLGALYSASQPCV